jgi:hypothetical protein
MLRKSVVALCALGVSLCPLVSQGQKKGEKKPPVLPSEELSRARTMAERGDTFFKLGEYEKALNEYKDAYLLQRRLSAVKNALALNQHRAMLSGVGKV